MDQLAVGNPTNEKSIEWHYLRPSDSEGTFASLANDQPSSWHWVFSHI